MKLNRFFLIFSILCLILNIRPNPVNALPGGGVDCSGGRYSSEIFSAVTVTSNIQYGQNFSYTGSNTTLFLDVYEAAGDTDTIRPLIIFAHGGSFLGGSKTGSDVVPLCQDFAKMGYVTASINYRIGMTLFPAPDSVDATEAAMRGTHDARAAVRFFRKDFSENGNTYGIDTSHIYFAGSSAGGFIALHMAYLDELSELPSYVDTNQAGMGGGIEGTSGNAGYSSEVVAIANFAGALGDTAWMKPNDTPVISFHGDQDNTVPFYSALIYLSGIYPIMVVDGSHSVHLQADDLGMNNCLVPHWGQDHVPYVGNSAYYDTTKWETRDFFLQFVCGGAYTCNYTPTVATEDVSLNSRLRLYPNPARNTLFIEFPEQREHDYSVELFNAIGQKISEYSLKPNDRLTIERNGLDSGLYFIRLTSPKSQLSYKVIFE